MPLVFPDRPFQIPDTTPVEERLRILDAIANEGAAESVIQRLAGKLAPACVGSGALAWEPNAPAPIGAPPSCRERYAAALLRAVQTLPYRLDPKGEWFQSARYTLAWGGDCEDLASLLVALCRAAGLEARIVWMDETGEYNHVSTQIYVGGRWQWAESIIPGASLGEFPQDAANRLGVHHDAILHP